MKSPLKFVLRFFIFLLILLAGYKVYTSVSANSRVINMRVLKGQWKFSPDTIKIPVNETWKVRIYNEDTYEHGFFVQDLGINASLPPGKTTEITILASKPGDYIFACSVICGAGHYRMSGKLTVTP